MTDEEGRVGEKKRERLRRCERLNKSDKEKHERTRGKRDREKKKEEEEEREGGSR